MKPSLILGVAGTLIAILALATFLIATDRDPALLVTILVAAVPLIAVLFGLNTVQKQTNGTLSKLREEKAATDAENKILRTLLPADTVAKHVGIVPIGSEEESV